MPLLDRTTFALGLGILGGFLLILSAFIQYFDKRESDKDTLQAKKEAKQSSAEAKKNAENLLSAQKLVIGLQQEANQTTTTIAHKTSELAESYKRNANLQEDFKNQVTGGNTIPTLFVWAVLDHNKNNPVENSIQITFIIKNSGKYVLNNVKATIADINGVIMATHYTVERNTSMATMALKKQNKSEKQVFEEWESTKNFDIGSLHVGEQFAAYTSVIPNYKIEPSNDSEKDRFTYPVNIKWNSGLLKFLITLKWSPDKLELEKALINLNGKELPRVSHLQYTFN